MNGEAEGEGQAATGGVAAGEAVAGAEDDAQEFIYEDDDDGDALEWGGAGYGNEVLAAVEGAQSAADIRTALRNVGGALEGRPRSARPPSGRLWSGSRAPGLTPRRGAACRHFWLGTWHEAHNLQTHGEFWKLAGP